jgi:hypothetical protein
LLKLIKVLHGVLLKWHRVHINLGGHKWEWSESWLLNSWLGLGISIARVEIGSGHQHGLGTVD